MRDLFLSPKKLKLGFALGMVFGLLAFGQAAQAANLVEKNFWTATSIKDGVERLKKGDDFRYIAEDGLRAASEKQACLDTGRPRHEQSQRRREADRHQ